MHWDANWHSGWFLGMHLVWWGFWILLLVVIWAAGMRSPVPPTPKAESPLDVLKRRYAEGALTTAEYEERKGRLTS